MNSQLIIPQGLVVPQWKPPGLDNLSQTLTINGTAKTPLWSYNGEDASESGWTADVGTDLDFTEGGTAITPNVASPFRDGRLGVTFNVGDHFLGPTAGYGDLGTDDFVVEALIRSNSLTGTFRHAITKFVSNNDPGWSIYQDDIERIAFAICDTPGTIVVYGGTLAENTLYHLLLFVDRSGSAVWYNNSVAQTAADVSARADTIDSTSKLGLGGGEVIAESGITIFRATLWKQAGWLDTHLQATVARERFHALTGGNSSLNVIS